MPHIIVVVSIATIALGLPASPAQAQRIELSIDETVGPLGTIMTVPGGTAVVIKAGAVRSIVKISIAPAPPEEMPHLARGYTHVGTDIRIRARGGLPVPVFLRVPIVGLPEGTKATELRLAKSQWVYKDVVDEQGRSMPEQVRVHPLIQPDHVTDKFAVFAIQTSSAITYRPLAPPPRRRRP